MNDWFSNRAKIEKHIVGAIKSAAVDHKLQMPPEEISSIAKRVYGVLKGIRRQYYKARYPGGSQLKTLFFCVFWGVFMWGIRMALCGVLGWLYVGY